MPLSIVIPVYNAQATIQHAILSASALGDVEIICVDDGSQDASVQRIEALRSQNHALVLVRHDGNRGVGAARNTGLARVSRRWVTFLDADDLIEPGANLVQILRQLADFNPELMIFLHQVDGSAQPPHDYGLPAGQLTRQSLIDLVNGYLCSPRGNSIVSHCWGKIYGVEFLKTHQLSFREDLPIYEDTEFVARCFAAAGNAYFSQEIFYRHTLSRGLSRSFSIAPVGFRYALEQFAKMVGGPWLVARANAAFLAKTLSLSRHLSLASRIDLCRKLAAEADTLEIDMSVVHDPFLRLIIGKRWYRHALACSAFLALGRWMTNK